MPCAPATCSACKPGQDSPPDSLAQCPRPPWSSASGATRSGCWSSSARAGHREHGDAAAEAIAEVAPRRGLGRPRVALEVELFERAGAHVIAVLSRVDGTGERV